MKRVSVDGGKCMGCRVCEIVCSSAHEKGYTPKMSRIRVPVSYPMPAPPVVCRQCDEPRCVETCPTGALVKGRWIEFHAEDCANCGMCVDACQYSSIWLDQRGGVLKCDTCFGRFECVTYCPEHALGIADEDESP